MPIRPEMRRLYGPDWGQISLRIRQGRAGWRCECRGECGRPAAHLAGDRRCGAKHGQPSPSTGSLVVLTTAHLDHDPTHNDPENLRAYCNGCHLWYDRDHHAETRRRNEQAARLEAGQEQLW